MTNETFADIIAEMRKISAEKYRLSSENGGAYGNPGVYHLDFAQFARVISDRLEAAHRRERGDCAKLREALCEILSYIESFHKYITPGKGKKLTALFAVADTIRGKAKAALAAPPRNCDRFANAVEAMAELKRVHSYCAKENRRCLEDCPDCGKEWCSLAWLFALATESEAQA
ncbi:MAG: hypothetical protein II265_03510 [Clostridia bacterium]|nr:hypothetical protein [Clostridia bacterium]